MRAIWAANGATLDRKYEEALAFCETMELANYRERLTQILAQVDTSMNRLQ